MPPLGTAPHLVSGTWYTRSGRRLSPAGQHYWDTQLRLGRFDKTGHRTSRPQQTVRPAAPEIKKPGFETIVAARAGHPDAIHHVIAYGRHLAAKKQAAAQVDRMVGARFGGVEKDATHAYKVVNPKAGAVITSLSPYTSLTETIHQARHHKLAPAAVSALGIFPFGPGKAARAAKEALAAEKTAATLGPESHVLDALGAAKEARVQTAALHSAERARRIKESGQAFHEAGGGLEGHAASLAKLRGELPKIRFDDLTGITDQDMAKLMNIVEDNPALSEWEALSLRAGLLRARTGQVPRDFEIALMRQAFGLEKATELANPSRMQKVLRTAGDVANIPRAVMSSADVSAVLRQSLVATIHRPGVAAKNIGPMFKMMFNQKFYDEAMAALERDPEFHRAVTEDGLMMTDVHGPMRGREEAYPSALAERIPIAGHVVKGSSRAYTGYINLMRWHVYNELLDLGKMDGALTPQLRRDAAKVANWATGRGHLPGKSLEAAAPLLNTVFFSPRLMASRFQTLNPFFYASMDPVARKYAMKAAVKTFIVGMTVLGAAAAAGAKVGTDPTSADFGKIKIGNFRADIWAGHQQWVKVAAQIYAGKVTSTTTGKEIPLSGGFAGSSRWDVASRFLQGKFAPPASLIRDWSHNTDFQGKPFTWKKAVVDRIYPLVIGDMLDTFHQYGLGPALAAYGLGAIGIGVQTYGPTKPKPPKGGGGSDPFGSIFTGDDSSDPFGSLFTG